MKKYFAIAFGALYMLFFAIPFPMIIYYSVNSEFDVNTLKDKNPWLALVIVSISIIFWLIVLIGYFCKWVLQIFISKRNIEKLKSGGVLREAKILSAVKTSKPNEKFNTYELELSFKNLADTEITSKTVITDARPHQRRFEAGKKIKFNTRQRCKRGSAFYHCHYRSGIKCNKSRVYCIGLAGICGRSSWLLYLFVSNRKLWYGLAFYEFWASADCVSNGAFVF
jgi:hypothetical protein